MQDVEFTIQDGKLWMLQTRSGKRTTSAALKIAVDMVEEGALSPEEALLRIDAARARPAPASDHRSGCRQGQCIATGLPASPGAASGEIVFDSDEAETLKGQGREVILVRVETSPEDIHGMHAAAGILTTRGGMTSHAAVVARGMGRPCVSGAGAMRIDYQSRHHEGAAAASAQGRCHHDRRLYGPGLRGRVKMRQPELSGDFGTFMAWADEHRRLKSARQRRYAARRAPGARVRRGGDRALPHRAHVLRRRPHPRRARDDLRRGRGGPPPALAKILPMQRDDFEALFEIMGGLPVTIRLLDPPLHEFLPHEDKEASDRRARRSVCRSQKLKDRVAELHEFNPMLGFRGCRLAIRYPEITEMQARAIFEAAVNAGAQDREHRSCPRS